MKEIKISIPDDLERELKEFKLDVSGIVVKSIRDELIKLVALKLITSRSKMTEEDAIELGREIKRGRFEQLRKKGLV